jgi:hypothetical protein
MKIETKDLHGTALDWAVARCAGKDRDCEIHAGNVWYGRVTSGFIQYRPSEKWDQGGPIIEQENLTVSAEGAPDCSTWVASLTYPAKVAYTAGTAIRFCTMRGPTPLIAAMRCYVASKLGDKIDVPGEAA